MAIIISILMSLGIFSNSANTSNTAHGLGKDIHKHNTENTTTTRGNYDWEDGH